MPMSVRDEIRAAAKSNGWTAVDSLLMSDTFQRGDSTVLLFFSRLGNKVTGGVISVPGDSLRIKSSDHNKKEVILDFLKN